MSDDSRRTRVDHLDAEALTRVLGQLGHEVGTPLGSVLMMAEMLSDADAPGARRHAVGLTEAAGEIRDLVRAFVRLVRLRTGWQSPNFAQVEGGELERRLRAAAEAASSTESSAVAVSVDDLPTPYLDDDYLADAVSEACRWAGGRSGPASLAIRPGTGGGLELELRSPGPAVPWHEPGILDPLAVGDLTAARRYGGRALELATVRMLLWRLGGRVTGEPVNETVGAAGEAVGESRLRLQLPAVGRDPLPPLTG